MIDNWTKSREYLERAKRSLAGGVSSPFRAKAPVPLYFRNGCGARLEDVDGNEYIDYVLAWGPMILGYRHPAILEAMRRQAELPADYGAQHELEFLVSEQIQKLMPCAELTAFTSSGSEACQIAFRLARAFTGRDVILKFEGHYHGWMDGALISYKPTAGHVGALEHPNCVTGSRGQTRNSVENFVVAPWNHIDLLARIVDANRNRIAADVRLNVRERAPVRVVSGALAIELPVVVPALVRVPHRGPLDAPYAHLLCGLVLDVEIAHCVF